LEAGVKAIRVHAFGGPEVLRWEDVNDPVPGPKQVLVRIRAAGVNPVEAYIRTGTYALKPSLPYTPGTDAGGIVEHVGAEVRGVQAGRRVYVSGSSTGTYAELALCEPGQVHRLPDHVTFAQGAAVNIPYATAYRALIQTVRAAAGEHVLVHGATGGVGLAATQIALALGMRVIATGGSAKGRELVRAQGVDAADILDHTSPGYLDRVLDLTDGRGANVILEMAAHVNLGHDLNVLAKNGRVAVIGNRGPVEINARAAMERDAAILGVRIFNASAAEMASIHAALVAGLANRTLNPIVGRELPLAEAPAAHRAVMEDKAFGKIVLVP
jgi:NADPH:quinone reductase